MGNQWEMLMMKDIPNGAGTATESHYNDNFEMSTRSLILLFDLFICVCSTHSYYPSSPTGFLSLFPNPPSFSSYRPSSPDPHQKSTVAVTNNHDATFSNAASHQPMSAKREEPQSSRFIFLRIVIIPERVLASYHYLLPVPYF